MWRVLFNIEFGAIAGTRLSRQFLDTVRLAWWVPFVRVMAECTGSRRRGTRPGPGRRHQVTVEEQELGRRSQPLVIVLVGWGLQPRPGVLDPTRPFCAS
jgi:hypothetical protein